MNNLYQDIKESDYFNRFEIGDLLFAEYTCPLEAKMFGIWTEHDYFVHVVSGKKTWHTPDGPWEVNGGGRYSSRRVRRWWSSFSTVIFV